MMIYYTWCMGDKLCHQQRGYALLPSWICGFCKNLKFKYVKNTFKELKEDQWSTMYRNKAIKTIYVCILLINSMNELLIKTVNASYSRKKCNCFL